jgi:BirA family biotin operon repressor/biotin-[acetyl-CoA-carboxylase] ligase
MMPEPILPPGFTLASFDTIGSTNDEAKRLAAAGAPECTVVWARGQTAGRGRQERAWSSPPGNLYCSVILRPGVSPVRAGTLGFVISLAAAEAIETLAPGLRVAFKWPNDVLLQGGKVAGILLETGSGGAGSNNDNWVVAGCGINLSAFPENTPYRATSVLAVTGKRVSAEDALHRYTAALDVWYPRWRDSGFVPVREAWLKRAHPPGTPLAVRTATTNVAGTFLGLDEDGVLLLAGDAGRLHRIAAGDVYFASTTA